LFFYLFLDIQLSVPFITKNEGEFSRILYSSDEISEGKLKEKYRK
jgi:hypothetical protein